MELTFLGGAREIGASSLLLEAGGHRLLIDGGMRPTAREGARLPDLALLDERPPEAILVTHAHIDHTGGLPLIAGLYPSVPLFATESTLALMRLLLSDSVRIMEQESLRPDGETPLYRTEQVEQLLARMTPVAFHQSITPLPTAPHLTMQFLPAGHILGAAMLLIETPEGRLLHTGDISVTDQRTVKGVALDALPQADIMICEGTYGNRTHTNRRQEEAALVQTVQAIIAGGGRVLLPAFAVGRAQELVLILKAFRASGALSPVPIYLDGMVRSVCSAYQGQSHDLHPSLQRFLLNARRPLFADPALHLFNVQGERAALLSRETPFVVISSSGMLTGGASPLYAAAFANRPQDGIVFSGYQDEESPGAAFLKAERGSVVTLDAQRLVLQCQVARYNLSAHADAEQLVHAIQKVAPDHLLLVHGAPEVLEALARRFPKRDVQIPAGGETISLSLQRRGVTVSGETGTSPGREPLSVVPERQPALPPPTLDDLWRLALAAGPGRPWTEVELGQAYYGAAYRPALRATITDALRGPAARFKRMRVGAQWTYQPRSLEEGDALEDRAAVAPGEIVLVQGGHGAPGLALVTQAPLNGIVSLVAEQWKGSQHPFNVVQLRPGVHRDAWLKRPAEAVKADLRTWHAQLEEEWVDLLAVWHQAQGKQVSFAEVCAQSATEAERLAWGMEFLLHGHMLFRRHGAGFQPRPAQEVLAGQEGFPHHLALIQAGAGAQIQVGERVATLTGRSAWQYVEVRWEDGQATRVRPRNAQLVAGLATPP
jgi:Cft2 family RNA processing exonuclease